MTMPNRPPGYKPAQAQQIEPEKKEPLERFKGYGDSPDKKETNLRLTYKTHDIDHSINLMMRLIGKGWKIRSAYHEFEDKRSIRIDQNAKKVGLI